MHSVYLWKMLILPLEFFPEKCLNLAVDVSQVFMAEV
jgi:hypothetical protein